MARGLNKVMLIGNLGNDPDVRATPSGMYIAKFSVATTSSRKDPQTSNWIDETEWHRVVLFGKTAEIAQQYLRKGSKVYIEGRLKTNKWQDQEGHDRYTTEVLGNEMQMLDSRGGGMGDQDYGGSGGSGSGGGYSAPAPAAPMSGGGGSPQQQPPGAPPIMNDFDDDIPF